MSAAALSFENRPHRSLPTLLVVVALHVVLVWALATGLAHRVVQAVVDPMDVQILERPKPPPPPEPEPLLPAPSFAPPPPSFVPPPEVRVKPPPVRPPAITATPAPPPPAPVRIAAPPAPVPAPAPVPVVAAPPAAPPPPAPPVDRSRPARLDVAQCAPPVYPSDARRAEATGTSVILFEVDAQGRVTSSQVLGRAGFSREHRMLDRAAMDALGRCRFEPGRDRQGQPVGGRARVEYVWRLQ